MKSQRGSITVYVTISCLFVLIIGIASYILLTNKQMAQAEMVNEIERRYSSAVNLEETYQSYVGGEIIPITSLDNFKKIGTGEQVYIDGKVYTFGINSTYVVQADLQYDASCAATITRIEQNDIVVTGLYTVTYNANGGTGTMDVAIGIGKEPIVEENTFTPPSGKTFIEWNTAADGSGTSYEEGASINSDLTLYAIWKKMISNLQEGDWVLYDTGVASVGTNGVIPCRVLYNDTAHGIQIISKGTVGNNVKIGAQGGASSYFNDALESYNNAIITLNTAAGQYLNATYAYDARCVGSYPNINSNGTFNNKNKEVAGPVTIFNGSTMDAKNTDTNYETDWAKMESLGTLNENIQGIGTIYWLTSHNVDGNSGTTRFCVRYVNSNGSLNNTHDICHVDNGGSMPGAHDARGIRPCFSLKTNLGIISGDGTSEATAYTLEP